MTISKDLLLSILAMDSYNQGYGRGLEHGKSKIGSATVGLQSDISADGDAQAAGFYAVSYKLGNETIISYRGTNEDSTESSEFFINALKDIWNGWAIGAGVTDGIWGAGSQAQLSIEFFENVVEHSIYDTTKDNVTLTGHSLGGGLAGFVSLLSDENAVLFDHMPFGAAAFATILDEVNDRLPGWNGLEPEEVSNELLQILEMNVPKFENITAEFVEGEVNFGLRDGSIAITVGDWLSYLLGPLSSLLGQQIANGQVEAEQQINNSSLSVYGWDGTSSQKHSQALLIMLKYAKEKVADLPDWQHISHDLFDALFDQQIGISAGYDPQGVNGRYNESAKLMSAIAYSALDGDEGLVFGNTGIRAMFNDANDLGKLVNDGMVPSALEDSIPGITQAIGAVCRADGLKRNSLSRSYRC